MFRLFAVARRFGFWAENGANFTTTARQRAGDESQILSKFTQILCDFKLQILHPQNTSKFNSKGGKCPC